MASEWRPGSFTKNYSWGPASDGLKRLHESINVGFDGQSMDVPRELFRSRISSLGRPDFIPLNFFLFNEVRAGTNYLLVDELVFQALNFGHGPEFDKLALYTFLLSHVGRWNGARPYQKEPALWAKHYVADRVNGAFDWNSAKISADDIEAFVASDPRYTGQTSRKLATNLSYLLSIGGLDGFSSRKPERWWLSAIFVTLDRLVSPQEVEFGALGEARLLGRLAQSKFWEISGPRSVSKDIISAYFTSLFAACGGRARFSEEAVLERERELAPDRVSNQEPEPRPVGIFHPSDPTSRNIVPHACRILARYCAGFEVIDFEDFETMDIEKYVRQRTEEALAKLKQMGLKPSLTADETTKLLRGE